MSALDDLNWFRILAILAIWVAAWIGVRVFLRLTRRFLLSSVDGREEHKRIDTMMRAMRHSLNVLLIVIGIVLLLSEFGISIAPILGAAGIAGIAVGFAAQSLVKDFFRGFFLLIENQIRVGDVVEVAGKGGVVEEVTLRYVRLRDWDGSVHFVPNGEIQTVTNRAIGFAYATLDVGVAYSADLDRVIDLMREEADALRADPQYAARMLEAIEIAGVEKWADSSVMIRARLKVAPLEQWAVRRELLKRIKLRFDAEGVEIPFPQVTLHVPDRKAAPA